MNPLPRPRLLAPPLPFPDFSVAITGIEARGTDKDKPWDHCPNCGERLQNARCKYRCPRCHYFMSCSDFD